jgi:hypothetical protein
MAAMTVSFVVVLQFMDDHTANIQARVAAQEEAARFYRQAQDLLSLTRDYLDRVESGAIGSEAGTRWLNDRFTTRLNRIRGDKASDDPVAGQIQAALDLLAGAASDPEDLILRQEAIEAVFEAVSAAEERAAALGVESE